MNTKEKRKIEHAKNMKDAGPYVNHCLIVKGLALPICSFMKIKKKYT